MTGAAPLPPLATLAGRLAEIAEAVRRLPPPDRRDPEAFHLARSELAAELRRLAADAAVTLADRAPFYNATREIDAAIRDGSPVALRAAERFLTIANTYARAPR